MKKLIAIVAVALFALSSPTAFADETPQWVRVTEEGVNLYANADCAKVTCLLEKSYYLSVLGQKGDVLLVSVMNNDENFPQITGYVRTADVEFCTETPLPPFYPTVTLQVSGDSAALRLSPTPSASVVITATNTQKLSYYGEIVSYNKLWYYVCYCGKFGYVDSESVTLPVIAMHPTPLKTEPEVPVVVDPTDDQPPVVTPDDDNQKTSAATEIVLIVFVCVLSIGLVLALFLPGNKKKTDYFDSDI